MCKIFLHNVLRTYPRGKNIYGIGAIKLKNTHLGSFPKSPVPVPVVPGAGAGRAGHAGRAGRAGRVGRAGRAGRAVVQGVSCGLTRRLTPRPILN